MVPTNKSDSKGSVVTKDKKSESANKIQADDEGVPSKRQRLEKKSEKSSPITPVSSSKTSTTVKTESVSISPSDIKKEALMGQSPRKSPATPETKDSAKRKAKPQAATTSDSTNGEIPRSDEKRSRKIPTESQGSFTGLNFGLR